jgi:Flp pilus assembly pilin Flp
MKPVQYLAIKAQEFRDECKGQDVIEYALLSAFVSIACVAFLPSIGESICIIMSKFASRLVETAAQ